MHAIRHVLNDTLLSAATLQCVAGHARASLAGCARVHMSWPLLPPHGWVRAELAQHTTFTTATACCKQWRVASHAPVVVGWARGEGGANTRQRRVPVGSREPNGLRTLALDSCLTIINTGHLAHSPRVKRPAKPETWRLGHSSGPQGRTPPLPHPLSVSRSRRRSWLRWVAGTPQRDLMRMLEGGWDALGVPNAPVPPAPFVGPQWLPSCRGASPPPVCRRVGVRRRRARCSAATHSGTPPACVPACLAAPAPP
jgi:hypothetical protein